MNDNERLAYIIMVDHNKFIGNRDCWDDKYVGPACNARIFNKIGPAKVAVKRVRSSNYHKIDLKKLRIIEVRLVPTGTVFDPEL